MRTSPLLAISAALAAQACAAGLGEPPLDSDQVPWMALEGDELDSELATSPIREAPTPFIRLGLGWDADSPVAIEIATSVDGRIWSEWRIPQVYGHEVEEASGDAAFVGELALAETSAFFRLRAGAGVASYLGIEFLEMTFAESLEDGNAPGETDIEPQTSTATINGRAAWGARPPKCVTNNDARRFTIHHTVTPTTDTVSPQARLRNIQTYHQDVRGWCDIGYHAIVSRDGRLWQGRGAGRLGSHVAGQNAGNIGIAFLGTYNESSASAVQVGSAAALIADIASQFSIKISTTTIKGHRDRGQASCPGDRLSEQIGSIVVSAGNGGDSPTPPTATTIVKGVIYVGADTSARVDGATITLGDRSVTTNETGAFEFADVEAAMFTLTASAPGFVTRSIERTASGAVTSASISLERVAETGTAILQGVVYRGANSSDRIPDAAIQLSSGHTATTDASGYYRLEGLPSGTVTITATADGASGEVTRELVSGVATWGSVSL